MVLLGFRQSISSQLREWLLIPSAIGHRDVMQSSLTSILQTFPSQVSTAAYIILCDGNQVHVVEKDRIHAVTISSDEFGVATNHDTAEEGSRAKPSIVDEKQAALKVTGMETLVEESINRKNKMCSLRSQTLRRAARRSNKRSPDQSAVSLKVHPPYLLLVLHSITLQC